MSFAHRIGTTYSTGAGTVASASKTVTGDAEEGFDGSIASGTHELDIALTAADVKALCLLSDKAVTVNTNAADATGGQSIALAAGVPLVWNEDDTWACPIQTDVTSVFVVNGGGSAAAVKLRFLLDVTP